MLPSILLFLYYYHFSGDELHSDTTQDTTSAQ